LFPFQLKFPADAEEVRVRARTVDALQIALRTQPNSFVARFVDAKGIDAILHFLSGLDYETAQSPIHTSLLACLKALMNNSVRLIDIRR